MSIAKVIDIANQMEADGAIERYAIGGAVGATFYLEPVSTLDVDIFVVFRPSSGILLNMQPIYDYLAVRGWVIQGEYVVIADWPVQFLPSTGPLVEEALAEAVEVDVDGIPARVFTAEHLAAVALQTGRSKDKMRLLQFVESDTLDMNRFLGILERHALLEKWDIFERTFTGSK